MKVMKNQHTATTLNLRTQETLLTLKFELLHFTTHWLNHIADSHSNILLLITLKLQ